MSAPGAGVLCPSVYVYKRRGYSTDGEWHAPAATGPFLRSFVCVSVFQFHATTVRHQNVFSAPALQVRVRYARARVYVRVHDDPFSPPPLHFKNVKEPFASTVRGSMKPGPSSSSAVKSGNSVSTTLASAPLGVRGGSPRERLPSGGWGGCVWLNAKYFVGQ